MTDELKHYGVKGMHWGIRRYQDENGSYTKAGLRRRKVSTKTLQRTANASRAASDTIRTARNVSRSRDNMRVSRKVQNLDLSSMTDQELRDTINRANLERQYRAIYYENTRGARGKAFVDDTLEYAGNVLALVGSAASLAIAIRALRKV